MDNITDDIFSAFASEFVGDIENEGEKVVEVTENEKQLEPTETPIQHKEENSTTTKTTAPKRSNKGGKEKVVKGTTSEEYDKEIKKLKSKVSSLTAKLEELQNKEAIPIDAQNTDDLKTVSDLMNEGKYIVDTKGKSFILSEYRDTITNPDNPIIHKVYCDDITGVRATRYYEDLENVNVEGRKFIKEILWVHHKGYHSIDMITRDQLKYLVDNGFVSELDYTITYVDRATSIVYDIRNKVPTQEDILNKKQEMIKKYSSKYKNKNSDANLPPALQLNEEDLNNEIDIAEEYFVEQENEQE